MSVGVGEETALEHLVVGGLDSWHEVSRSEGALLGLSKVVVRVLV
jgi:hypothetical protein